MFDNIASGDQVDGYMFATRLSKWLHCQKHIASKVSAGLASWRKPSARARKPCLVAE